MDPPEEEQEQMAAWFTEEGLAPGSSKEAQLCFLWRAHQRARSSQEAKMADVRKSLEKIRFFTEHKDVLAQEIQDENDQLKDRLQRLITFQDAQISEMAKMLYQQGLTELIHSSPSEQMAYLLVERASLLEMSEVSDKLTGDGNTASPLGTETQVLNSNAHQSSHKRAPHHGQSAWKKLFGLKASQSKPAFIPTEDRHCVKSECSRLLRDLEEGSRRLAMAHSEIRHLTDELESAHLTQRAYEPELQAAQQEVQQLRQEVQKLKTYEMAELRKAKELNDRLDLEIRALRTRVRSLDAEKNSMYQKVVYLQKEVERLQSLIHEQQQQAEKQLQTIQSEAVQYESVLQKQQQADQQLHTVQVQANQEKELAKSCETELNQISNNKQTRCLLEKGSQIHSCKQLLDNSHREMDNLKAAVCTKVDNLQDQDQKLWKQKESDIQCQHSTHCQLEDSFIIEDKENPLQMSTDITWHEDGSDHQEAVGTLLYSQNECEILKKEICETLKCLDKERSKNHEIKEKHKAKLCRAKQKFDDETTWRDEKIKSLDRELSLCSHSLAKEKELVISITVENEKLLVERRRLLQQLNDEEHSKKDSNLTASLSRYRVDFLEMENKKLGNKIIHMSKQLAVLERTLNNKQALHFPEELKKICIPQKIFTSVSLQTSHVITPELSENQALLDDTQSSRMKQTDTTSPHCFISAALTRSAEMSYLNLSSIQSHSDQCVCPAAKSSSENGRPP